MTPLADIYPLYWYISSGTSDLEQLRGWDRLLLGQKSPPIEIQLSSSDSHPYVFCWSFSSVYWKRSKNLLLHLPMNLELQHFFWISSATNIIFSEPIVIAQTMIFQLLFCCCFIWGVNNESIFSFSRHFRGHLNCRNFNREDFFSQDVLNNFCCIRWYHFQRSKILIFFSSSLAWQYRSEVNHCYPTQGLSNHGLLLLNWLPMREDSYQLTIL